MWLKSLCQRISGGCLFLISCFYGLRGHYAQAIFYLEKLTKQKKVNDRIWWRLAIYQGQLAKWDLARQAVLWALRQNQRNPRYLFGLALLEEEQGNLSAAAKLYDQVLVWQPDYRQVFVAKGNLAVKLGDYQGALLNYYKALQLGSSGALLYNNIAVCQLKLEHWELADSFLQKARKLKPRDATIIYNYAWLILKKGDYPRAIKIMRKLLKEERVEVFAFLGYAHSLWGEPLKSLQYYKAALRLAPQERDHLVNLACTYVHLGEKKKAIIIFRKLLAVNPYDANLLNNLAWLYESLNDYEAAEKNYYRGLALTPQDPQIIYNLSCCLTKQHKYCEALEMITVLKKIPQWSSKAWAILAQIYEKMGEKSLAVDCYNRAFGLN